MNAKRNKLNRRDFMVTSAGATLAVAGMPAWGDLGESEKPEPKMAEKKSQVVLVRDAEAVDSNGKPNAEILPKMLDRAVTKLLGVEDPVQAWKQLVRPEDTVGVKSNVWRFLPTPPALEEAIVQRLQAAGVAKERISVADRGILQNPIFQNATALINVRPMRTHHWSGVGSLIKNLIMFSPRPYSWHEDSCANLAGLWDLPLVKGKTRLNILVMLTPLFHGKGPHHYQSKYIWPYRGLLVGLDPVAVDAVGVRILQAQRRVYFGKDEPFAVPPKHIEVAEKKYGLGVADPARIELVKLGWMEEALI